MPLLMEKGRIYSNLPCDSHLKKYGDYFYLGDTRNHIALSRIIALVAI